MPSKFCIFMQILNISFLMQLFSEYLTSILIGYFLGSFPTAYLIIKLAKKKDIRQEGSGIVGTMNAFEVSESIAIGIFVLIIDLLKGSLAIVFINQIFPERFWAIFFTSIFVVIGHIFPIWLKFKGGRGLAVTAGIMLVVGWIFIVIWIINFAVSYIIKRDLHFSNIIATIISPIILFILPEFLLNYNIIQMIRKNDFIILAIVICVLLLISHKDQIIKILRKNNGKTKY